MAMPPAQGKGPQGPPPALARHPPQAGMEYCPSTQEFCACAEDSDAASLTGSSWNPPGVSPQPAGHRTAASRSASCGGCMLDGAVGGWLVRGLQGVAPAPASGCPIPAIRSVRQPQLCAAAPSTKDAGLASSRPPLQLPDGRVEPGRPLLETEEGREGADSAPEGTSRGRRAGSGIARGGGAVGPEGSLAPSDPFHAVQLRFAAATWNGSEGTRLASGRTACPL